MINENEDNTENQISMFCCKANFIRNEILFRESKKTQKQKQTNK